MEELIRIEGFDKLPDEPLPAAANTTGNRIVVTPLQNRVRTARRVLAGRGFLETVTWSFMFHEKAALLLGGANKLQGSLTIDNPIASDLDYMRPSMLANLAEAAQRNADHGAEDVRLFEAGPVYPGDKPEDQRTMVAAVVKASKMRTWQGAQAPLRRVRGKGGSVRGARRARPGAGPVPGGGGGRSSLASGQVGYAAAWAEDDRGDFRRAAPGVPEGDPRRRADDRAGDRA